MKTYLINTVRELGLLLLEWRKRKLFAGSWDGAQYKAEVDVMAHKYLCHELHRLMPDIPVLSEEEPETFKHERPVRYWLIDPIDGTASFVQGFDGFVTQIALIDNNVPMIAAVYAPVFEELFIAERGRGAYCNERQLLIHNSTVFRSIIDNYPEPQGICKRIYNDFAIDNYIESGSIALKICRIADKTADLFVKDVVVRDWDLAAPHLILEEAGGWITYLDGESLHYRGSVEHNGIIASSSKDKCEKIVKWNKQINS